MVLYPSDIISCIFFLALSYFLILHDAPSSSCIFAASFLVLAILQGALVPFTEKGVRNQNLAVSVLVVLGYHCI